MALTPKTESEDNTSVPPKRPGPSRFVPTGSLLNKSREGGAADEILSPDKIVAKLGKPVPAFRANGASASSGGTVQTKISDFCKPEPSVNGNDVVNGQNRLSTSDLSIKKRSRSASAASIENDSVEISLDRTASRSKQAVYSPKDEDVTPRRKRFSAVKKSSPEQPSSERRASSTRRAALIAKRQSNASSRYSPELPPRRRSAAGKAQNTYSRRSRRSISRDSYMELDLEESSRASSSLDFDDVDGGGDLSLYLDEEDGEEASTIKAAAENAGESLPCKDRSSSVIGKPIDPLNTNPGDLMWARVGQPVFWACAITQDPNVPDHVKVGKKGKAKFLEYHVQFFGRPMRAWVTKANFMPYLGVEDYHHRVLDAKSQTSANTRKKLLKELIPQTQKQQWQEAFDEMVQVERMDVNERISYLKKRLDEANQSVRKRESYVSISSVKEKRQSESETPQKSTLKPTVTERAPEPADQLEAHRKIVSKLSPETIEKSSRRLTTGFQLYKLAKCDENRKTSSKEAYKEAEKKWRQLWNSFSKSVRRYYTDTAMKLASEVKVEIKDDESVDESVASQPLPARKVSRSVVLKEEKMPFSTKYPFKKESFCVLCEKVSKEVGDLLKCNGVCHNFFHTTCLNSEESRDPQTWKCEDCLTNQHSCFICKSKDGNRVRCSKTSCGKFYHRDCLRSSLWPQARFSEAQIICPYHMCHTCASDDPKEPHMKYNSKLLRCTRCPTSYHFGDFCVAAGTNQITALDVICPKHFVPPNKGKRKKYHFNTNWCFICSLGGSLICCELCPSSFHLGCINLDITPDKFYCSSCETGRLPLYGELVWAKLGRYRWWAGQVQYPEEVPETVLQAPHVDGQFAVKYCGTEQFNWMHSGQCFPYQEGDSDKIPEISNSGSSSLKKHYLNGIKISSVMFEQYMEKKLNSEKLNESKVRAQPHLRPPLYTKIKSNKPYGDCMIYHSRHPKCECPPDSNDPCGPTSNCINRVLHVECLAGVCTFGDRCGNRMFQKKLYPPMKVEHTKTKGWGLFVKTDIKKGDFIIEYVGELITSDEFKKRIANMINDKDCDQNYYFMVMDSRVIDAGPKGNNARFINHSCNPNCETVKWTVNGDTRIGIFALEDIPANTELTFNYQFEAFGEVKKPCLCGAENCCGFIGEKPKRVSTSNGASAAVGKKKKMKREKKEPKISKNQYDDWCYRCYNSSTILDEEVESLILCDFKGCLKSYHLGCVSRDTVPHGKWYCPWHHCVTCGKLASSWCDHCPNGYCKSHSGPLKKHPVLKSVCDEHMMDLADMLRYYKWLSSEYRQDRLQLITEPQVILTEGVPEPKRRRVSQASLSQQELFDIVNCEVDFCSWYGNRQTLLEHMEALHSSSKKPWTYDAEKPMRPREATFRCPVESCCMETRASLLRRHIQAKHPKIYREKYCDESVFLMEMTKGKIGTPKAPLADMRLTRSPKFNDYNVPASSACVPCLLPDCKKFIHHSNMARHFRSLHSDIDYNILKNHAEESDLPPEPSLALSAQTRMSSASPGLASRSFSNAPTPTTQSPLKGNVFFCNFGDCEYVSKVNSNMWRHRRKYSHFVTESEPTTQFFYYGQQVDESPLQDEHLFENENQGDEENIVFQFDPDEPTKNGGRKKKSNKEVDDQTKGGDVAVDGQTNVTDDDDAIADEQIKVTDDAAAADEIALVEFREGPQAPVEPEDAILGNDDDACVAENLLAFGDDLFVLKREAIDEPMEVPIEVSSNILYSNDIKREPLEDISSPSN